MLLFYILQKSLIGQKNCIFSKDLFTYHFVLPILSKANLHPPIPGPRGLRRGSADARLLGLRVRIPLEAWMSVSGGRYVLSGRGLCDRPIPLPEEPYRVWCLCVWSRILTNEAAWATVRPLHHRGKKFTPSSHVGTVAMLVLFTVPVQWPQKMRNRGKLIIKKMQVGNPRKKTS